MINNRIITITLEVSKHKLTVLHLKFVQIKFNECDVPAWKFGSCSRKKRPKFEKDVRHLISDDRRVNMAGGGRIDLDLSRSHHRRRIGTTSHCSRT
jgi:hypothetical protein